VFVAAVVAGDTINYIHAGAMAGPFVDVGTLVSRRNCARYLIGCKHAHDAQVRHAGWQN
jgi:hypothetical protein